MADRPGDEPAHTAAPDATLQLVHKFLVDGHRELVPISRLLLESYFRITVTRAVTVGFFLPFAVGNYRRASG